MSGPEPVARWQIRFTGREGAAGPRVILLDQDVEWLAGPGMTLPEYGLDRWHLFLAGFDPLFPDLEARLDAGLTDIAMVLTDGSGLTATYGPLDTAAARAARGR